MNAIITFALKQRILIVILLPIFFLVGYASFRELNIEAYPDPVPPLIEKMFKYYAGVVAGVP